MGAVCTLAGRKSTVTGLDLRSNDKSPTQNDLRRAEYNVTVSRKVSVAGGSKSLASKLTELRLVLCYEAETWPVPSRSCAPDLTPHETREM